MTNPVSRPIVSGMDVCDVSGEELIFLLKARFGGPSSFSLFLLDFTFLL